MCLSMESLGSFLRQVVFDIDGDRDQSSSPALSRGIDRPPLLLVHSRLTHGALCLFFSSEVRGVAKNVRAIIAIQMLSRRRSGDHMQMNSKVLIQQNWQRSGVEADFVLIPKCNLYREN